VHNERQPQEAKITWWGIASSHFTQPKPAAELGIQLPVTLTGADSHKYGAYDRLQGRAGHKLEGLTRPSSVPAFTYVISLRNP